MNYIRLPRRLAAAGVAAALGTGGLVVATTAPAHAAPVVADYTCSVVGNELLTGAFPVSFEVPTLPASLPTGQEVPAGTYPVSLSTHMPGDLAGLLDILTDSVTGTTDFAPTLDGVPVPVTGLELAGDTFTPDGLDLLGTGGSLGAFTVPEPGSYGLLFPAEFGISLLDDGGLPLNGLDCVLDDPPEQAAPVEAVKQTSTTDATLVKRRIVKGKRARVEVFVERQLGDLGSGEVIVKKGSRTWGSGTLEDGHTLIRTRRFKRVGSYQLTIKYLGDAVTRVSRDTVTVKVVRPG